MTYEQLQQAIYDGFYSIARIGVQPPLAEFLAKTLKSTWSQQQTPGANPTIWWDATARAIQTELQKKGGVWRRLTGAALKILHDEDKTWADAVQAANADLVSTDTLDN